MTQHVPFKGGKKVKCDDCGLISSVESLTTDHMEAFMNGHGCDNHLLEERKALRQADIDMIKLKLGENWVAKNKENMNDLVDLIREIRDAKRDQCVQVAMKAHRTGCEKCCQCRSNIAVEVKNIKGTS